MTKIVVGIVVAVAVR